MNKQIIILKKYRDERKAIAVSAMTLRDHFAAAALTGLMAHPDHAKIDCEVTTRYICGVAYAHADLMLIERERDTLRGTDIIDPRDEKPEENG
jgi:hypothetical protein